LIIKSVNHKQGEFHLNINELNLVSGVNLIFGESGSGKSTFVDVLVGFKKSKNLSWIVNGNDLALLPLSQKKIGLVLQNGVVFPHLTGKQCAKFAAESRGLDIEDFKKDFNTFLRALNLEEEKLNRKTMSLSGGERQRLAILCALIGQPNVLILDEPFSSLDSKNKESALQLVTDFCRERRVPVIVISHDKSLRGKVDKVFEFSNGKIVT